MLKNLLYILFCLGAKTTVSQTLINVTSQYINNPSFEDYTNCPLGTSDPNNYWIDSCLYWFHATYASPDYLNSCSNAINPLVGVPNNYVMGRQLPFHGNGYLGLLAHSVLGNGELWCEYIGTKLKMNLAANKQYKYTMRISPSKNNACGVSKIGAHFSQNSLANNTQKTSFKFAPTLLNSKGIIDDTTKWFLFDEEFTATGQESFLTIGWFADTLTSDNGYFDSLSNTIIYPDTYYAIDSINILEVQSDLFTTQNLLNGSAFEVNIITPNNDGANEVIDFSKYNFTELSFTIYNRWGVLVYKTNDIRSSWDGKNNDGKTLSDGTYYYLLEGTTSKNEAMQKHNYIVIIQ